MDYFATSGAPSRQRTDCAIVGIFASGELSEAATNLDRATHEAISTLVKRGDFAGKVGDAMLLPNVPGAKAQRILLTGLGKSAEYKVGTYRRALGAAIEVVKRSSAADAISFLPVPAKDANSYDMARAGVATIADSMYRFDRLKTKKPPAAPKLKRFGFGVRSQAARKRAERGAAHASAIALGSELARDLGNLPANICTPSYLAREARALAKQYAKLTTQVLNEPELKKLGMGSFLSVTAGSRQPARFIVCRYRGAAAKTKPHVLIGKGITFDTGGVSIKPALSMDEMKYDMCGAASVLGTLRAIAELGLKVNVVGLVPCCENMPDGNATKPGDIIKTMSGQTVEVLNTDAEGRLILCDALTYSRRFKPKSVVDIATLTGACVIALGDPFTGLMTPDDDLAGKLLDAGKAALDPAWRLPVTDDYFAPLKSNFADFANVGGRAGGAATAACFLWQFAKDLRWAHLDIAATAWRSGQQKGATGRPVGLLVQYLLDNA